MSVPASYADGGGSAAVTVARRDEPTPALGFPSGFPFPTLPFPTSLPFGPPPPAASSTTVTDTSTLTILPIVSSITTTTTTLATNTEVSTTTTTTLATNTNIVSSTTTTQTSFSVTALPNPAATAGLAAASSLLTSNASLTRTNITVSLVLGVLSLLLIIIIAILFFIYVRRRRKSLRDDESPPFTSLAPRPAPFPILAQTQSAPQMPPDHMRETSLSMGPRGGTADSYNRALKEAQDKATEALNSHPLTRPSRSFSAPVNAPEPAPRIPPFDMGVPSINILPTTPSTRRVRTAEGSEGGTPSPVTPPPNVQQPVLRRTQPTLQRVPMYHAALQEQAERQRQSAMAETAGRLGLPVVVGVGREERGSVDTMGSDVSGYEDNGAQRDTSGTGGEGGMGTSKGGDTRTPIVHSTRASSGVFPEGREEDEDERKEREEELEELEKAVQGGNGGSGKGKEKDES